LLKSSVQGHARQLSVRVGSLTCGKRRLQPGFYLARNGRFTENQQNAVGKQVDHGLMRCKNITIKVSDNSD
jgi:hypothetical protein